MIPQGLLPINEAEKLPLSLPLAPYGLLTQGSNMIAQELLPVKEAEKLPLSVPWPLMVLLHEEQI